MAGKGMGGMEDMAAGLLHYKFHPPSHPAPALTCQRQDAPMASSPSATYQRQRDTIAERMRMSHVYQPLMLMELLGHGFARQQPARPQRRQRPGAAGERIRSCASPMPTR